MRWRLLTLVGFMVFGWLLLTGSTLMWTWAQARVAQHNVLPHTTRDALQSDANRHLQQMLQSGGNAHLRAVWFSSRTVRAKPDPYTDFDVSRTNGTVAWSPDASLLAFTAHADYAADIFLLDVETALVVPLTTHPAWDSRPSWSPDGKRIAFLSTRDTQLSVYVTGLTPGRVRRLTSQPVLDLALEWSPDGRAVSFVVAGDSGRRRVTHALSPGTTELAAR